MDLISRLCRKTLAAAATVGMIGTAAAGVLEVPDPQLPDISMFTHIPGVGLVIFFNPELCKEAGPDLCAFYRAHERAHAAHRDDLRQVPLRVKESEADCTAARSVSPQVLRAALRWFGSGGGGDDVHGSGAVRAQRIALCAGQQHLQPEVRPAAFQWTQRGTAASTVER